MTTPQTVRPGTAEQLARLAHFSALERTQPEELDAVAFFLLGDVGDVTVKAGLWGQLREDCGRLWHLITEDWDENDLLDACDEDEGLTAAQELDARHERTQNRLCSDIERRVYLARYAAVQARGGTVADAVVQSLLSAR